MISKSIGQHILKEENKNNIVEISKDSIYSIKKLIET